MDLNLLKTFDAVMNARSVNVAAEVLGITSPAVSQALNRLREQYGDPLFVRAGRGIRPTNFAVELHAEIQQPLLQLVNGTQSRHLFNPETSQRKFRVSSHKDLDLMLIPSLVKYRQKNAPHTKFIADIEHDSEESRQDDLRMRKVDIIISTVQFEEHGYHNELLFKQDLVVALSREHPRIQGGISEDAFFAEEHILWQTKRMDRHTLNSVVAKHLPSRRVAYSTGSAMTGLNLAADTEWLCVSSRWHANQVAVTGRIQVLELPFETQQVPVYMAWHHSQHKDPGHQWLREAIVSTSTALYG